MEKSNKKSIAPAITLMVLAPLLAEVSPGATRFSSLFVFPIEILVWGGGALLIRFAVRKWNLGWINLVLLALALSIAEEFLIQQTSLAPMVVKIKGITYARAFGINYVYLLWALIYESVFVVVLPIYLSELIYFSRREELWIGKKGITVVIALFLPGAFLAWYSWTQIARPNVFHLEAYNPPFLKVMIGLALIGCFLFTALGPFRNSLAVKKLSEHRLPGWLLFLLGNFWAILLYGVCLLAFGILPQFPSAIALIVGVVLAFIPMIWVPRLKLEFSHKTDIISIVFGLVSGSMLAGFIGFIGAAPIDLYFKIAINILAYIFLSRMWIKAAKEKQIEAQTTKI